MGLTMKAGRCRLGFGSWKTLRGVEFTLALCKLALVDFENIITGDFAGICVIRGVSLHTPQSSPPETTITSP